MTSETGNTDVRINTKINIYGNVVMIGSISFAGVGFLFLFIWMRSFWAQAVTLSAVIVYGLVAMFFLAVLGGLIALYIRFVVFPTIEARQRNATIRGQELKNRLVHWQENAIVYESLPGEIRVQPLFPQQALIEAPKEEKWSDKATVMELFNNGSPLREIAARTGVSYYQVQKWTSEEKAKTGD